MHRHHQRRRHLALPILVLALATASTFSAACAGNRVPIIVAQSGLAVAQSIGALSDAGKQLEQAAVLPTAVALGFQKQLLAVNEKLKPLPDILRTIDDLQQAEASTVGATEKAVAILTVVGQDISVVIGGVPLSDATASLITLIRTAQQTIQGVLVEVAKIQGREEV